jgi:hypothetical protein
MVGFLNSPPELDAFFVGIGLCVGGLGMLYWLWRARATAKERREFDEIDAALASKKRARAEEASLGSEDRHEEE